MKKTAVITMCGGLALLGFVSAGYASGADGSHSSVTTTQDSCPSSVTTSGPITIGGGGAQVSFTVAAACAGVEVTLVSYAAPSAAFDESAADQQVLFRATTMTALSGPQLLTVEVPDCFFQVDFVYGPPLQTLGPAGTGNFYGAQGRLILFATGGVNSCSTSTTTATSSTATATPPPTTAPTTTAPPTTTVATVATVSTAPQTTTSAAPSTTVPTTALQTTTSTPPSTTVPTTAPQTTTSTPPTATVATTTENVTTSTTIPAGPIVPPSTTTGMPSAPPSQQSAPPPVRPSTSPNVPSLSFTGARLPVVTAIGFFLLIAGLVLWFLDRLRAPAIHDVSADPIAPAGPKAGRRPEYRVLVPGVGSFASLAEADQWLFELRLGRRRSTAPGTGWRVEPAG
jgi:hypothetical protein